MYLVVVFRTCSDQVILVLLGTIGFNGLMVVGEVTGFGELAPSSNLVLV